MSVTPKTTMLKSNVFLTKLITLSFLSITLDITIRRSHLFEDSLKLLKFTDMELKVKLTVTYQNEEGVDAGKAASIRLNFYTIEL